MVNSASIPAPLWSTVGSPYTGPYRRASIVHDVACAAADHAADPRTARPAADHMFYQACLAGGCSPAQTQDPANQKTPVLDRNVRTIGGTMVTVVLIEISTAVRYSYSFCTRFL